MARSCISTLDWIKARDDDKDPDDARWPCPPER
jgi:hypothetical protein